MLAKVGITGAAEKPLRLLTLFMATLGGLSLAALLLLVCANIAMRPFGPGIRGTVEMSGYLCALAVGLCMPAAQLAGSHIRAGLWADLLPARLNLLLAALCNLICAWLLALAGLELYSIAEYAREMDEYIDGFDFSYFAMALGFALGVFSHAMLFAFKLLGCLSGRAEAATQAEQVDQFGLAELAEGPGGSR